MSSGTSAGGISSGAMNGGTTNGRTISGSVKSGLVAGLISAVIWMAIATLVDFGKNPVIFGGLAFLTGTWLATTAISEGIRRGRSRG